MRTLRDLLATGQYPQNFLQVGDRAPIDLGMSQPSGPALDYTQAPIEIAGYGKGYRVKGDPLTAVLTDGRIVRMGEDTGAAQARQMAQLKTQEQQQKLGDGVLDRQIKQAQLDELMGIDPSVRMAGQAQPPMMPSVQPSAPMQAQQPDQASAFRQKFLTRRFGNAPAGHRWDEQGRAIPIPGVEKPLTEFQGKAAGYGSRAAAADAIISEIGADGKAQPGLIKRSLEAMPVIGDSLGTMSNWTQSANQQQIEQAQRDFINAVLRQESGAAIAESEFNNAQKQYFPQPGDTPEVIAQKAMNRQTAINAFTASAGPQGAKLITSSRDKIKAVFEAKKAIAEGRSKEAVIQRLESLGITNHGIK